MGTCASKDVMFAASQLAAERPILPIVVSSAASASVRRALMSAPVLMPTGHFSWHMPSAAQVSMPRYW